MFPSRIDLFLKWHRYRDWERKDPLLIKPKC